MADNNIVDLSERRKAKKEADAAQKVADTKAKRRKKWIETFGGSKSGDQIGNKPVVGGAVRVRKDDEPYKPDYVRGSKDDPWMQD